MSKTLKKLAIFDLDHTITHKDSGGVFIMQYLKKHPLYFLWVLGAIVLLPLWKLKLYSLAKLKEYFFHYIKNRPTSEIDGWAKEYVNTIFPTICKEEALQELKKLQDEGFVTILISASPSFYVKRVAKQLKFDHFSSTNFAIKNNVYTGKIEGNDCRGEEKIVRLKNMVNLDDFNLSESVAYSDSRADIPFLKIVGKGYFVPRKSWTKSLFTE